MSTELTLQQTNASDRLLPARFSKILTELAKASDPGHAPRGGMHGQELRLALGLPLADPACAAFLLEFAVQGFRVTGSAHGPGAVLLSWGFHTLAAALKCTLFEANVEVEANPEPYREAAIAYLSVYEADVRASREGQGGASGALFVAWLARDEHVVLAKDADASVIGAALEEHMHDPPGLYELLLDSEAVEDVFVSERELSSLLSRFHARGAR